jgi:hypothetical protein
MFSFRAEVLEANRDPDRVEHARAATAAIARAELRRHWRDGRDGAKKIALRNPSGQTPARAARL